MLKFNKICDIKNKGLNVEYHEKKKINLIYIKGMFFFFLILVLSVSVIPVNSVSNNDTSLYELNSSIGISLKINFSKNQIRDNKEQYSFQIVIEFDYTEFSLGGNKFNLMIFDELSNQIGYNKTMNIPSFDYNQKINHKEFLLNYSINPSSYQLGEHKIIAILELETVEMLSDVHIWNLIETKFWFRPWFIVIVIIIIVIVIFGIIIYNKKRKERR